MGEAEWEKLTGSKIILFLAVTCKSNIYLKNRYLYCMHRVTGVDIQGVEVTVH